MKPLGKVIGCAADVTDLAQVRDLFDAVDREFGQLDILVNNAGAGCFPQSRRNDAGGLASQYRPQPQRTFLLLARSA